MKLQKLPLLLLVVGSVAILNAIQCFRASLTASTLQKSQLSLIYSIAAKDGTLSPLTARLMGVWNFTAGALRIFAALNISQRGAYDSAVASFVIAFFHFASEAAVFDTTEFRAPGIISPLLICGKVYRKVAFLFS